MGKYYTVTFQHDNGDLVLSLKKSQIESLEEAIEAGYKWITFVVRGVRTAVNLDNVLFWKMED